jgi:hypothetical protein
MVHYSNFTDIDGEILINHLKRNYSKDFLTLKSGWDILLEIKLIFNYDIYNFDLRNIILSYFNKPTSWLIRYDLPVIRYCYSDL